MRKVLRMEARESLDGFWDLIVVEQSHRHSEFGDRDGGDSFTASNGFGLSSIACPQVTQYRLFVRGMNEDKDNLVVHVSTDLLEKIEVVVREYNEKEWDE